jgi:hypothetical protein
LRKHQIGDGTDHWLLDLVLDCMYIDHVSTFFPKGISKLGGLLAYPACSCRVSKLVDSPAIVQCWGMLGVGEDV